MNGFDKEEKRRNKEYKKHPMINLADSINHTMIGDIRLLARSGCFTTVVIIFATLFIISRCSN